VRLALHPQNVRTLPHRAGSVTRYWDAVVSGLVLRVYPSGVRSYTLDYRFGGRRTGLILGRVDQISLAEARLEARRLLAKRLRGEDPAAARRAARARGVTVAELIDRCIRDLEAGGGGRRHMPLRPKTSREWRRIARVEIGRKLGTRLAHQVSRQEVRDLLQGVDSRYVANNVLALLRRAYSWGIVDGVVESSPCEKMPKPKAIEPSGRALSRNEVRWLWHAMEEDEQQAADVVRLLLFTGVRRDMVQGARRSEFELRAAEPRWIVPGGWEGRSKTGLYHVVPLSGPAVDVVERRLDAVDGECLFRVLGEDRPMGWSSRFVKGLKLDMATAMRQDLAKRQGVEPGQVKAPEIRRWTVHNLRHTIGTHMIEDLGVDRDVVSLILGHTQGGASATRFYDRSERLPHRRAALVSWAAWVLQVATEEVLVEGAKVLQHHRRGGAAAPPLRLQE